MAQWYKFFAVMNMAPSSASAADNMTNFMTLEIINMGPLHLGIGLSSARKMWDPARLRPLDLLCKPASECATSTIFLDLYKIPSLGQVEK